jgi:uncharacterized SAM-binding protein YcdF (DUF218 family)
MPTPESPHSVIVLGSGVTPQNRPGFDGKIRVLALQELLKTTTPSHIILTGGYVAGKNLLSEAEAMKEYLLKDGAVVPPILLEKTATDTIDNIQNTAKLVQEIGDECSYIITNAFHKPRVELICQILQFSAQVIAAEELVINRSQRHADLIEALLASKEVRNKVNLEILLYLLTHHTWGRTLLQLLAKGSRI